MEEAILVLDRLAAGQGKRRGRPPAWMSALTAKRSGRPPGSERAVLSAIGQFAVDDCLECGFQVLQLLSTFAALALVLAALGIFGVLSYVVSQRRRKIALRIAIGASQWDIIRGILGYSVRLTAAGLAAGMVAAIAATRLLSTLLYACQRSILPHSLESPGCCCWWRLCQRMCPHDEPRRSIRQSL